MVICDPGTDVVGLLPRVCALGVPRQCKTHGHSGIEDDLEDLESELLAAFVAIDVPAAFCAPEVFVDAAMIAFDSGVSMLGAALSAFEDAAMLCFQKSQVNGETGVSHLVRSGWFWGRFLDRSGVFPSIMANARLSPFRLSLWPDGLDVWRDLRSRGRDGWVLLSCGVLLGMLLGCSESKSSV